MENVINHERFFKLYPGLKDVNLIIGDHPGITAYYENTVTAKFIGISTRLLGTGMGTGDSEISTQETVNRKVIHEIQHAIQDIEGFSRGANPQIAKDHLIEAGILEDSVHKIPYHQLSKEDQRRF